MGRVQQDLEGDGYLRKVLVVDPTGNLLVGEDVDVARQVRPLEPLRQGPIEYVDVLLDGLPRHRVGRLFRELVQQSHAVFFLLLERGVIPHLDVEGDNRLKAFTHNPQSPIILAPIDLGYLWLPPTVHRSLPSRPPVAAVRSSGLRNEHVEKPRRENGEPDYRKREV